MVPQGIEQLCARQRLSRMVHEHHQQLIFHGGEKDLLLIAEDLCLFLIDGQIVDLYDRMTAGLIAADDAADAAEQLLQSKRLGHIVITAQVQPLNDRRLIIDGTQEDDRPSHLLHSPADGEAAAIRQPQIDDAQITVTRLQVVKGLPDAGGHDDLIALPLQGIGQSGGDRRIVFHK